MIILNLITLIKEKVDRFKIAAFALWASRSSSDQNLGKYTYSQSSIRHMFIYVLVHEAPDRCQLVFQQS